MKATRFRRLQLAVTLIALAAILSVTAFANAPKVNAQGKVLRYSNGEPETLDPQLASFVNQVAMINALHRGLLRTDDKGKLTTSIATEIPTKENGGISADGLTYTYKLKDWKWSDGKGVVTAGDFVYAWRRLVDPKVAAAYSSFINEVVNAQDIVEGNKKPEELGVKAVDDKTFQVTLRSPIGYLNDIVGLWVTFPVRKDVVEASGDYTTGKWTDPANGVVVGTGPFIMTSWTHGNEIVFEKNKNFSGSIAKLDKVVYSLNDEPATHYAAYKAGELDIAFFPVAELAAIQADAKLSKELIRYDNTCVSYLAMNNTKPPFNDKKVRQAFAHAIDRDTWVKVLLRGVGKPYYSFLPVAIPGGDLEIGKQYDYNPEKARKLLADAGYPGGKGFPRVRYNYVATAANQTRFEWFQNQFKQNLGIDLFANPMDSVVYQAKNNSPIEKFDGITRAGWCADYFHASNYFSFVLGGGDKNGDGKLTEGEGNALNNSGFLNKEYDALTKSADAETDPAKQVTAYKKIGELLVEESPVVFMTIGESLALISPKLKDVKAIINDGGEPGSYFWEDIDFN